MAAPQEIHLNAGGARAKAAEYNLDCAIYSDHEKMLAEEDIDIISVASPPVVHAEHAIAAVKAGKHLMLEKAMANTLPEIRAIRDAVAEAGVKSVVSFVLRWNPLFEIIKTQLAEKNLGDVYLGEFEGWYDEGQEE